jgi:chromosome partitioning protein
MSIAPERKKPFVIAVGNGKGGVGKTTTALAVGTILARRGLKILFIDLDPQGNLTLSLGHKPHRMPPASKDMPTAGTILARDSFHTKYANIHLVFARSLIVNEAYQVQVNTGDELFFLGQDLSVVRSLPYDFVIIDCPPSIEKIVTNTLFTSDFLIIPCQTEFFSAIALNGMIGQVDVVKRVRKTELPFRILITLFDKRNQIHNSLKDYLRNTYASHLFGTIIETDIALRETAIHGFPTDHSRGVSQYRKLVDELMDMILGEQ